MKLTFPSLNAMWNQRDRDVDSCFALGCGVPSAKSYWEQGIIDMRNVSFSKKHWSSHESKIIPPAFFLRKRGT